MNYLAHVLLSQSDICYQLGNLLTDRLKGRSWQGAEQEHLAGIAMHKFIDKTTDSHPIFQSAQARLGKGYLRGVAVDIIFDHFLSKYWEAFVRIDLSTFVTTFNQQALKQQPKLPESTHAFIRHIVHDEVLRSYRDLDSLRNVFRRVDHRLSDKLRAKETLSEHFPTVIANYEGIESDFLAFFPDLVRCFLNQSGLPAEQHWLRVDTA